MQSNWPRPSELPELLPDAVHVWRVPLDLAGAADVQFVLSPEERVHAARFAIDRPRQVFIASRAALRSLLGRYLGVSPRDVTIVNDSQGKPQLTRGDLCFNLAHSGELALIAVTRGCQIGIDLELLRPVDRSQEIAARNFHPAEIAAILATGAEELPASFLRCWTRKEAVLKAVGVGLGYPLDAFNALAPNDEGCIHLTAHAALPATQCWLQDVRPQSDYVAAVATLQPRGPAQGFTYSP